MADVERVYNVRDPHGPYGYAATGNGVADDTNGVQAAIDAAAASGGGVVYFPNGTYRVQNIVLANSVQLLGESRKTSWIAPYSATTPAVITLGTGEMQFIRVARLSFVGENHPDQRCFNIDSTLGTNPPEGGMWWSIFEELYLRNWHGSAFYFLGTTPQDLDQDPKQIPNQFIDFRNVIVDNSAAHAALHISGQCGQFNVVGCAFQGAAWDSPGDTVLIEHAIKTDSSGTEVGFQAPYSINFYGTAFESKSSGVRVRRGFPVTFTNCWFEQLGRALYVSDYSQNVMVTGCMFADAGRNGVTIVAESRSSVVITNCSLHGDEALHYRGDVHSPATIVTRDNQHRGGVAKSQDLTWQGTMSSSMLSVGRHTTLIVDPGTFPLESIASDKGPGEYIVIRPWDRPMEVRQTGNIDTAGKGVFTAQAFGALTLVRFDRPDRWVVTSVVP